MMTERFSAYVRLLIVAGLLIGVDQATKAWVRLNLAFGEVYHPEWALSRIARLVHVQNYGAAGGILPELSGIFTVLPFLVSLGILYYYPRMLGQSAWLSWSLPVILGGAVGNLIDRLHQGFVTDFISVGSFPVLNIADACISVGAAALIIGYWLEDRRSSRAAQVSDLPDRPGMEEDGRR